MKYTSEQIILNKQILEFFIMSFCIAIIFLFNEINNAYLNCDEFSIIFLDFTQKIELKISTSKNGRDDSISRNFVSSTFESFFHQSSDLIYFILISHSKAH